MEPCGYCDQGALFAIFFSGAGAYQPVCADHFAQLTADAKEIHDRRFR